MVADLQPAAPTRFSRQPRAPADRSEQARLEARHDATLVRRFVAGDESAFAEIVMRYRARMFHVALGLLRNHADAEEIAQDTFIRAHRGLVNFRGESSLVAWLYCIALNLARNRYWYFHRRHRHAALPLDAALSEDGTATYADMITSSAPGPVREAVNREFASIVLLCTEQLPPGPRQILTLRNLQHQSYASIGRLLGIRIGTVKSRVARARRSLRLLLGQSYPEFAEQPPLNSCFESLRAPLPGWREAAGS